MSKLVIVAQIPTVRHRQKTERTKNFPRHKVVMLLCYQYHTIVDV